MELLNRFIEWLEKNFPTLLLAFGLGWKEGDRERRELEKNLLTEETKRKLLEDEKKIMAKNSGRTALDIVNEIAGRGNTAAIVSEPGSKKPSQ